MTEEELRQDYLWDTLGYDYKWCRVVYGENSAPCRFLKARAKRTPDGWDAKFTVLTVIYGERRTVDESERVMLYRDMSAV